MGTTSAHAENTRPVRGRGGIFRNYLRVRGEYIRRQIHSHSSAELPPRTRRIRQPSRVFSSSNGTTSAYAENTAYHPKENHLCRNYLRVRGEYNARNTSGKNRGELPPRTRRIRKSFKSLADTSGTTSAYAENTLSRVADIFGMRNYLRVRGEYTSVESRDLSRRELPPRARRILQDQL